MGSVLIAALLAATPATLPTAADPAGLDRRCFALMAEIAEDEDPRLRALGRVAAPYFLGRIDAIDAGVETEESRATEPPAGEERGDLLIACGDAMLSGGYDFEGIGDGLTPPDLPAV